MKKAIVAKKIGMTQVFNQETGEMIPVTVLEAGPCVVTQVKTVEHDGYSAVQVGFGDIREKLVNKPDKGQFAKAGVEVKRMLEELKLDDAENYKVGDVIKADMFAVGDKVDASGISKGKGIRGCDQAFMVLEEDRWSMVLSIIAMQDLWDPPRRRAVYLRVRSFPVTWAM